MIRLGEIRHIPFKTYFILAAATMTTMGLSNASLGYLNYPTQVVFKCCKLIPVLIGGIYLKTRVFRMLDFCAAILMCIGLTIFTLADSKVSAFNKDRDKFRVCEKPEILHGSFQ